MSIKQKVYVGMSGGVDSSVTAALLQQQGYDVTGVYMKNWSQDLPGFDCPWRRDFQDAQRVAVQLGIPFKMYDFEAQYRQKVVDYMLDGYRAGITPNPDIMCNQEIKFKLFLETALADGADLIATGHYARLQPLTTSANQAAKPLASPALSANRGVAASSAPSPYQSYGSVRSSAAPSDSSESVAAGAPVGLFTAANKDKDQTYFLYRVRQDALARSLFPIGEFATKAEVRAAAKKFGLATADKKDSQGICFVGKVGIKEFLQNFVQTEPGNIVGPDGKVIGRHDGALFYTIGQRHGLDVGGGLPYYVVGKDMAKNEVYVTTDLNDNRLWRDKLQLTQTHWINDAPDPAKIYQVRTRYRAPLVNCHFASLLGARPVTDAQDAGLELSEAVRAVTPGQSAVIYDGDRVVGGGIVV